MTEMDTLRKECEVAKTKCKDAQEKYFSESDRLKAIIDEMQGKIWALFPHELFIYIRQILFASILT